MSDEMPDLPEPTAALCFAEAAANLRAAEQQWMQWVQDAHPVDDARVRLVVEIADAWTRLGVGVSDAGGFGDTAIPIRFVDDRSPEPAAHPTQHQHVWSEYSGLCKVPGCSAFRGEEQTGPPVGG